MKQSVTGQSDTQHRTPAAARVPSRSSTAAPVAFVDNRPEAIAQRRLTEAINHSAQVQAQRRATDAIHHSPYMVAQRQQMRSMYDEAAQLQAGPEEEELLQGKFAAVQRQAGPEEEALLQGKFAPVQRTATVAQLEPDPVSRKNNTGLPDNLKSGIESLSGMSMDAVRVHYNSSQPAQLNALAYAQGTDIHVAPGQEQHLPHEAWHIVQQAQGRVTPTMQLKGGVPVNDDAGLEHEADVMGANALATAAKLQGAPDEPGRLQGRFAPIRSTGMQLMAVQLLVRPDVTHRKLYNIVYDLYKGEGSDEQIGDGSTADAIRQETKTNAQVGGRWHSEKGRQYTNALKNWLRDNPTADEADIKAANDILADLADALKTSPR